MRRLLSALSALAVAFVVVALFAPSGCGPTCPTSERVVTSGALSVRANGDRYFETSPSDGPFLPFDGYTLLHVKHGLGVRPDFVQVYLSFNALPELGGNGGSSYAAGNQALLLYQDAEEIWVQNDSCANYFVRVTAVALPPAVDAGADGAPEIGVATNDAAGDSEAAVDAADGG